MPEVIDTHIPTGYKIRGYTEAQLRKAYEQGLLDAMNATRPFGRTGEVIAICIAALKETK